MSIIAGRPLDHPSVALTFRRHFLPPIMGILVMLAVFAAMNTQWLAAKWYTRTAHVPTIGIPVVATPDNGSDGISTPARDPNAAPDNESRLTIPALGIVAPVIHDEKGTAEWQVQKALQRGVVHYPNTGKPGEPGNMVIFGHSSGYPWAPGDYKFVFAKLEQLVAGDDIIIDRDGKRYIYRMTNRRIVAPTEVDILDPSQLRRLTLVTCHPVGSDKNRLVITAELVSPTVR